MASPVSCSITIPADPRSSIRGIDVELHHQAESEKVCESELQARRWETLTQSNPNTTRNFASFWTGVILVPGGLVFGFARRNLVNTSLGACMFVAGLVVWGVAGYSSSRYLSTNT